jgi:hypothetical protein
MSKGSCRAPDAERMRVTPRRQAARDSPDAWTHELDAFLWQVPVSSATSALKFFPFSCC